MAYTEDYYNQTPRPGQEFGAPRDNGKRTHQGTDFSHSTKPGSVDVPIVEGGTVTANFYSDGYGWRVEIGPWSHSHLDKQSPLRVGEHYSAGTICGKEGTTGATSGPCMHIEYVQNGKKVDPVPVINNILKNNMKVSFDDMSAIRIIDSPSYRAASQRVIHNGSVCMTVPAGWVQDMIQRGGVDYAAYEDDNILITEVTLVWQMGGLDSAGTATRVIESLKQAGISEADAKRLVEVK